MIDEIRTSIKKFGLDLTGRTVLTEAASGNYACTPLAAALSGAHVFSFGRDSRFGSFETVKERLSGLCSQLEISERVNIINDLKEVPFGQIDLVTNTGFLRPIDSAFMEPLTSRCVISLMYEPWELRKSDVDVDYCRKKGIKVFGTNEADVRLQTMRYIGFTVLYFLLREKKTPFSANILLLGSQKFNEAISDVLRAVGYPVASFGIDDCDRCNPVGQYNVIVLTEFVACDLLIGRSGAIIDSGDLSESQVVIHIAGNVEVEGIRCTMYPERPAPPNYMSYTADFIDPVAVIDLHTAGLKVGEGMLAANELGLADDELNRFMESGYPALAVRGRENCQ